MRTTCLLLIVVVAMLMLTPAASAQLIGVQFAPTGSPALLPGQVAGVVPQDNYNAIVPSSTGVSLEGISSPLADSTGTPTGITLTYQASSAAESNTSTATANGILLHNELQANGFGFAFNNVPAGSYDLIVYLENNSPNVNVGVSATVGVGPQVVSYYMIEEDAAAGATPPFVEADSTTSPVTGNYVEFDNVTPTISLGEGFLQVNVTDSPDQLCSVNGFQLESVPEPACILLLVAGGVLLRSRKSEKN